MDGGDSMKSGTVRVIENFPMKKLKRLRSLRIYLPPDYERNSSRYPVLYMQDGQNLFYEDTADYGEIWNIKKTLDELYNEGKTKGIIVVGIDSDPRLRFLEYSPWNNTNMQETMPHVAITNLPGGGGFGYIDYIVNELKPYIDKNYKTLKEREFTAIGGSSMGAFIALAAAIKYQHVFSKVAALSSASFFAEKEMKSLIENTGKKLPMKIYMDVGTKETNNPEVGNFPQIYMKSNKEIYKALKRIGLNDDEIKFEIIEGAIHNEGEWAKRFPEVVTWLF